MTDALREAAQQALEALEGVITDLRAAKAEDARDWSLLEATQESLREHMAEVQRLRAALAQPATIAEWWAAKQAASGEPVAQYSDIVSDGGFDPRNAAPQPAPAPAASGEPAEPVAWAQLGMRNGHTYVRMHYEGHLYPPPPDVQRNLNLVPLYTTAQPAPAPADIAAKLRDPVVVHAAMLRGEIATPAIRDMLHVYGADAPP